VLSLSPGETPVIRGDHVSRFAQMWRISDDFWDEWPMLEAQFVRLENWNPVRREGAWPDPDMLPLGRLALGARDSRFTPDEQRTVMTLWAITRSPLIMGGDLRYLDDATLALLTNREVIEVDQHSTDNRPHFEEDRTRIWSARDSKSADRYLALFNTSANEKEVGLPLDRLGLSSIAGVRDLWSGIDLPAPAHPRVSAILPPHGSALLRLRVAA
jgi:alpha-galactosidase